MFRTFLRSAPVALTAVSALAFAGAPAAHATPNGATTVVCHGGTIASGDYYELVVHGTCTVPDGAKVTVETQLYVTAGSTLNAITTATVHVKGNIQVGRHAVLGLGCNQETNCMTPTRDEVGGNINSDHATAVILHSDKVKGDITTLNDGPGVTCAPSKQLAGIPRLGPGPTPAYDDFEDNRVGGYITTTGLRSCWMGVIRNHVGTNILVADDKTLDPDGNEVVSNRVRGDLGCYHNKPAAQIGDSQGSPNVVNGLKLGECASL